MRHLKRRPAILSARDIRFSKTRFALNVATPGATRFVSLALTFFITPYAVYHIGFTLYGMWALVFSSLGYVTLLELGFGTAYMRLVADRSRPNYTAEVNGAAWALTLYNIALSCLVAAVMIPLAPIMGQNAFHIDPHQLATWRELVGAACLYFLVSTVGSTFPLTLTGLQYISELAAIDAGAQIAKAVALVLSLHFGLSIWALLVGESCATAIKSGLSLVLARRHIPGFRWFLRPLWWQFVRANLRFGAGMQITRLVDFVNQELDSVLIGILAGPRVVGYYQIGLKLATLPQGLSEYVIAAFFPEAAARLNRGDKASAVRFYWSTLSFMIVANGFMAGGIVALAASFIPIWFRHDVPYAALVAGLIAAAYAIRQVTGPGITYLWAQGESLWPSMFGAIGMIINVVLTVLLAWRFGFLGVIWGSAIGISLGSLLFIAFFHRRVVRDMAGVLSLLLRTGCATVVAGLLAAILVSWTSRYGMALWQRIGGFMAGITAYVLAFMIVSVMVSLIDYHAAMDAVRGVRQWTRSRLGSRTV